MTRRAGLCFVAGRNLTYIHKLPFKVHTTLYQSNTRRKNSLLRMLPCPSVLSRVGRHLGLPRHDVPSLIKVVFEQFRFHVLTAEGAGQSFSFKKIINFLCTILSKLI
jgi:hypothetical protein